MTLLCFALAGIAQAADPAQVGVGGFPTGMALDPATGTLYVGNGTTNSVSVIDTGRCQARSPGGCPHRAVSAPAGANPVGIVVDHANDTLYVVDSFADTVVPVRRKHCTRGDVSGCRGGRPIKVGSGPEFLALDAGTQTLYVASLYADTVSVIDARTNRVRGTIPLRSGPFAVALDEATSTIYVAMLGAPTVAVVDGRTCNAADVSGCSRRHATVRVGLAPGGIALDPKTHTVYVSSQAEDDVTVIDGRTCNGGISRGCAHPAHVAAGQGARGIAIDEATGTVYVANTGANTVSVIDGATCNASVRRGCTQVPASVAVGVSPRRLLVDPRSHTVYVTNAGSASVSLLDARSCNARVHLSCPLPGSA